MKKFVVFLSIFLSVMFVIDTKDSSASYNEYTVSETGIGKQLLNPDDITLTKNPVGQPSIVIHHWIELPKKSIYTLYISGEVAGAFPSKESPMRVTYKYSDGDIDEDGIYSVYPGGWGAYTIFENSTDNTMWFAITEMTLYGNISDVNPEGKFMLQKESSKSKREFVGYYDYISPDSGFLPIDEELNYVTYKGKIVTNDEILSLIYATDNTYNGIKELSVDSNNYKDEIGDYEAKIKATDTSGNTSYFTLTIRVIPYIVPVIIGENSVTVKMSEMGTYSLEKLYSNFKASYGSQSYTFTLTDFDAYAKAFDKPGETPLTIKATFSGGKTATLNFNLVLVDDISPSIYVSQLVLNITVLDNMSEDAIMDYIENTLSANSLLEAKNIKIVENNYEGFEDVEGAHIVYFTYESNGQTQEGSLVLNVRNESVVEDTNTNQNYKELMIIGGAVLSIGLIGLLYKSKKNKKHVI